MMKRADILRYALPFVTRAGVVGANIVSTLALAWAFAPEIFGKIVFVWNFVLIYSAVLSLGVPNFLLRELSFRIDPAHDRQKLSLPTMAALIVIVPLLFAAASAAGLVALFGAERALFPAAIDSAALIAATFMMSYLVNLTAGLASAFVLANRINHTMFVRDGLPSVTLIASIFLPDIMGDPALSLFANFILIQGALALAGMLWLATRHRLVAQAFGRRIGAVPNLFGFWGLAASNVLVTGIDVLVGGWILGTRDLGHYQLIKRICNLVALPQVVVAWAIAIPAGQAFARPDAGDRQTALQEAARYGARLSFYPLIPLLIGGGGAAVAASAWFGYGLGAESLALIAFSLLSAVVTVIYGPGIIIAAQTHLEYRALAARIAGVTIFLVLALLASRSYSSAAVVAACQLASVLTSGVLIWWVIRRRFAVDSSIFCLTFRRSS
ncbi:MAG: hypothetical protein HEQ22_07310 [Sphingopyxis sp.]|uniref:hypothetical protein n=1 Tax=Sphingopyxis sp. TaxID=1908224 RepID=UPI003D80DEBB